jgi:hypothetical protein
MNAITLLSIDVGSKELVTGVRVTADRSKVVAYTNDSTGRVRLIAEVLRLAPPGSLIRVGLEANRYIRAALYMPALVAIRRDPTINAHYRHLVEHSKKPKMVAIVAVMRKLLLCIHAILKSNTPFDPTKLAPKRPLEDQSVVITA